VPPAELPVDPPSPPGARAMAGVGAALGIYGRELGLKGRVSDHNMRQHPKARPLRLSRIGAAFDSDTTFFSEKRVLFRASWSASKSCRRHVPSSHRLNFLPAGSIMALSCYQA
jgi:hypothetical protein